MTLHAEREREPSADEIEDRVPAGRAAPAPPFEATDGFRHRTAEVARRIGALWRNGLPRRGTGTAIAGLDDGLDRHLASISARLEPWHGDPDGLPDHPHHPPDGPVGDLERLRALAGDLLDRVAETGRWLYQAAHEARAADGAPADRPPLSEAGLKRVNLALQGGGAHGAFTWGVLDRLLEDGRLDVEGVSATSAGAMNAAVLAHGLMTGGNDGAREALERFWRRISQISLSSPMRPTWFDRLFVGYSLDLSPGYHAFDLLTRHVSPYQFNPSNLNPMRELLHDSIDFDRLRASAATKLFVAATNVLSGKVRIFETAELSADVLLASACLPSLFQAVEIDGEHYWDGGYTGNPSLFPLIHHCGSGDVIIVHINPIALDRVPTTARDITDRANAITFNASLMGELRSIQLAADLARRGQVRNRQFRKVLIHSIEAEDVMAGLGASSKMNPDWDFLVYLRDVGRERTAQWLDAHYGRIGRASTVDVRSRYL